MYDEGPLGIIIVLSKNVIHAWGFELERFELGRFDRGGGPRNFPLRQLPSPPVEAGGVAHDYTVGCVVGLKLRLGQCVVYGDAEALAGKVVLVCGWGCAELWYAGSHLTTVYI